MGTRYQHADLNFQNGARLIGVPFELQFSFDGGGVAIVNTILAAQARVPWDFTVSKYTIIGDAAGSAAFYLWADTLANYPPTSGDNICASAPPSITTASFLESTTLTGWTTPITGGLVVRCGLTTVSTFKKLDLILDCVRA